MGYGWAVGNRRQPLRKRCQCQCGCSSRETNLQSVGRKKFHVCGPCYGRRSGAGHELR